MAPTIERIDSGCASNLMRVLISLTAPHTMLEVANLIAVVGGDTTAHEVRQRALSSISEGMPQTRVQSPNLALIATVTASPLAMDQGCQT